MVGLSAALPVAGRRVTYLVLGGALLLPFGVLASMIAAFAPDFGSRTVVDAVIVVLVPLVTLPAFGLLPPVQQLELTAARELLQTPPLPPAPRAGTARRRVAGWFAAHVLLGAIGSCVLLSVPLVPVLVAERLGDGRLEPFAATAILLGILVAGPAVALLLGWGLAALAPHVLGPSAVEQMALMQAQAGALAQRARLAREVHDSVGHALSVVTLQAAAARHVFDRDPEFARTALGAVEETARAALDELDHVLGLLAEAPDASDSSENIRNSERPPSLADLDELLARTRLTGVSVNADLDGARAHFTSLDPELSRQAYRIVQEAVTNAVRHGGGSPVGVHLRVDDDQVAIDVHNRLPATEPDATEPDAREPDARGASARGRRGLAGLHRRVIALGGSVHSGPDARPDDQPDTGTWRVVVHLPLENPSTTTESPRPPR